MRDNAGHDFDFVVAKAKPPHHRIAYLRAARFVLVEMDRAFRTDQPRGRFGYVVQQSRKAKERAARSFG